MDSVMYISISLIALCLISQLVFLKILIKGFKSLSKGREKKKSSKCPYKIEKEDI